MSLEAMLWAKKVRTGTASRKAVLLVLADYADESAECFPGQKLIAAETELGERTVRRLLAELEEVGLLERTERRRDDGYRTSDRIRLVLGHPGLPAKLAGSDGPTSPASDDTLTGHLQQTSPANMAGQESTVGTDRGTDSTPPTPPVAVTLDLGTSSVHIPATAAPFDRFWTAYPRHEGKRTALAAFERACRRADPEAIVAGALRYRNDPNREGQFTAHPSTWLNRDGWDDDPLPPRAGRRTAGGDGLRRAAEVASQRTGPPPITRRPPPALGNGGHRSA
jgi:hypothetical protein